MEKLSECLIKTVTFHNEENGYSVLKCSRNNYSGLVTVVGHMPQPHPDTTFDFRGEWKVNPKYGRQYSFLKVLRKFIRPLKKVSRNI